MIKKFNDLIRAYAPTVEEFAFVQVGANDGRIGDPLYSFITEYGWRGVLIEPQKEVFEERLLLNYSGNDKLSFENVAIDEVDGQRELFMLSFSTKRWAVGLSSFRRSHLEHHIDNGYVDRMIGAERQKLPEDRASYISSETVTTMSFNSLLDKYGFKRLDLLQMDAEGYDYKLLKLFDFDRLRPAIVQLEMHVMSEQERRESRERLERYGYLTFKDYINMVAIQQSVAEDLAIQVPGIAY